MGMDMGMDTVHGIPADLDMDPVVALVVPDTDLVVLDTDLAVLVTGRGERKDNAVNAKHSLSSRKQTVRIHPGRFVIDDPYFIKMTLIVSSKSHPDPDLWHRHYHHHNLDTG